MGKVNNLGFISNCPDIYLSLENNSFDDFTRDSTTSPGKLGGTSSKRTDTGQKTFSNRALDNSFIAPETLFSKFQDHTAALDVWSFGMIMFCLLFGRKPESLYSIYRAWYKKRYCSDVELTQMPFVPPSQSNFLYDPFTIDFDNPFEMEEFSMGEALVAGNLQDKQASTIKFENCMKSIKNLSYSSMFTQKNSKKFHFSTIAEDIASEASEAGKPPLFPG